jgi:RNA-directed DNA polymerase
VQLHRPTRPFGPHWYKANGHRYLGASPSKKSVQRLKTTVGNLLVPGNNAPWQEVRDKLNRTLRGWSNYFRYGARRSAFRSVDRYTYERVRDFFARLAQSGRARNSPVLLRSCLRRTRRSAS